MSPQFVAMARMGPTKVLAINGSPRKGWNTASLLERALQGAASKGAETELVHLYDLEFKGCVSCFACKRKGGKSYGRCAVKDGLTPLLEKVREVDALILGSPVYLETVTAGMKALLERLLYPYLVYDEARSTLFPRQIRTAFIYTSGATEELLGSAGALAHFKLNEALLSNLLGHSETLLVTDTLQFSDYSKYVSPRFDPEAKAARRREVFPLDLNKAFELGARLGKGA